MISSMSDVYRLRVFGKYHSKRIEYPKHTNNMIGNESRYSVSFLLQRRMYKEMVNTMGTIKKSFT